MDRHLFLQAAAKFLSGGVLLSLLLFLPAGTLHYWQAWLLLGLLLIPMLLVGITLLIKNPAMLRKRLQSKETEPVQQRVVLLSGLLFTAEFLTAGFCRRFHFLQVSARVSLVAAALFLLGGGLALEVLRENAFLSRIVEVQEGQRVIDTGLYSLVRHPLYLSTCLMYTAMPLVLGSFPSFLLSLAYLPLIALRIRGEEEVLENGLAGYRAYQEKVRYKVIPFVW